MVLPTENVGFRRLSVRQFYYDNSSLVDFAPLKSPIAASFARNPPHYAALAKSLKFSLWAIFLQTSRLRGFNAELVKR